MTLKQTCLLKNLTYNAKTHMLWSPANLKPLVRSEDLGKAFLPKKQYPLLIKDIVPDNRPAVIVEDAPSLNIDDSLKLQKKIKQIVIPNTLERFEKLNLIDNLEKNPNNTVSLYVTELVKPIPALPNQNWHNNTPYRIEQDIIQRFSNTVNDTWQTHAAYGEVQYFLIFRMRKEHSGIIDQLISLCEADLSSQVATGLLPIIFYCLSHRATLSIFQKMYVKPQLLNFLNDIKEHLHKIDGVNKVFNPFENSLIKKALSLKSSILTQIIFSYVKIASFFFK